MRNLKMFLDPFATKEATRNFRIWWPGFRDKIHCLDSSVCDTTTKLRHLQQCLKGGDAEYIVSDDLLTGTAENDYPAMIKGLFNTFTKDKGHNYDTLQKAMAAKPANYTHDGIMRYLHFMSRYATMMAIYDRDGKSWAYQLYKAISKLLPTSLYEVLRAETRRNCGNQRIDYRSAIKNGLACLISTVNQTEDDYTYVHPDFGRGGVDAQVAKFFSNPVGYMSEQGGSKLQTPAPSTKYVARRPAAYQAAPTNNPKRSRCSNLVVANLAQPEEETSADSVPDGLSTDEEAWFYHANASSELTEVQTAVLAHIQENGSWPSNITLSASGEPYVQQKVKWNQSVIKLPELSTSVCPFCPGTSGHGGKNCPKTSYDRFRQANALRLCRMCLDSGHVLRDCKYKRLCTKCEKYWHNEVLCNKKFVVDKAKIAAQVKAEIDHTGPTVSDNRRTVKILMADGSTVDQFEQVVIQDTDTGVEVVCFVHTNGNPILPPGKSLISE
jgi:hypothetical protein